LRFLDRNSLTILLYHGVAPDSPHGIYNYRGKFISPELFERQIRYLSRQYTILPLDEAFDLWKQKRLPPRALAITFDDGYENNYAYAYPVLRKQGVPATIFITTDFVLHKMPLWFDRLEYAIGVQTGTRAERVSRDAALRAALKRDTPEKISGELRQMETSGSFSDFSGDRSVYAPLTVAQIKDMQRDGITIGAHTKTHPILSMLTPEGMQREIEGSRDELQAQFGPVSRVFAYPNGQPGDWNETTERAVQEAGFLSALTTIEGVNGESADPLRLRRIALDGIHDMTVFDGVVSGLRAKLRRLLR
jgi:peptidoglycan/xylan/chitin deacetylase (PgdA/CDA1 family)